MSLASEFRFAQVGFSAVKEEHFYHTSFSCVPAPFIVIYRALVSLYLTTSMIVSMYYSGSITWLRYLTSWTFLLCTLYYLAITITTGYYWISTRNQPDIGVSEEMYDSQNFHSSYYMLSSPVEEKDQELEHHPVAVTNHLAKPLRVVWVLFETSFVISLLVMVMFWSFIFRPEYHLRTPISAYRAINEHSVNFVLLLVDFMFHRIPVRVLHVVYPITFGLVYVVFNAVYTHLSNKVVYKITDWVNEPGYSFMYVCLAIAFIFVGHFVLYGLHRLKLRCGGGGLEATDEQQI